MSSSPIPTPSKPAKCTTCKNTSCKRLQTPSSMATAASAPVRFFPSYNALRGVFERDLRHTDAVWPRYTKLPPSSLQPNGSPSSSTLPIHIQSPRHPRHFDHIQDRRSRTTSGGLHERASFSSQLYSASVSACSSYTGHHRVMDLSRKLPPYRETPRCLRLAGLAAAPGADVVRAVPAESGCHSGLLTV